jgi:hypothetical protein
VRLSWCRLPAGIGFVVNDIAGEKPVARACRDTGF